VLEFARGRSGAISKAAADMLSAKVVEPAMGQPMSAEARNELAELIGVFIDGAAKPGRAAVGWGVAGFMAFALVVVGGVVVADRISKIEDRLEANERYSLTLANYLVVRAHNEGENTKNIDAMLRQIAAAQGVNTSTVPRPVATPPPPALQRRDAQYRESKGE
jgi:hypothetical protein